MMTFTWPIWFLLLIPLCIAFWLIRFPNRLLATFRAVTIGLLLLALCGLSIRIPSQQGVVVVVADRSFSMPLGSETSQAEAIELLHRSMGSEDKLAVVSFAETSAIELAPDTKKFTGFAADVGQNASHLASALDRALSLIPSDMQGRILVLSDGNSTGSPLGTGAAKAASSGVAIDYRPMQRPNAGDLAIERIDAPTTVAPSEAFLISAYVASPIAQDVEYQLLDNSTFSNARVVQSGTIAVGAGRTRLLLREIAGAAGSKGYTLKIQPSKAGTADPILENNDARFIVGVRGSKPILCISPTGSKLPELLAASDLKVQRRSPADVSWTLTELSGYSAVLLENTQANQIGEQGMRVLAAWVSEAGGGLWTTGGKNSYGQGGYFKSPLEPILPVSMELRQEHRKLSLAIVVALDRSGSMAMVVPGGRPKMDLANLATVEVLKNLSGNDQFGCLAVDTRSHEIVPLSDLKNRNEIERKVLSIQSMGGGIFVYEALRDAAAMIADATAGTRHIILFADAADSEEPGDYVELLRKCQDAGITVSVIGLGKETDSDANLLKDIAAKGGGQCMFTEDAHELPRLFAQDMFAVSRSTFIEDPTAIRISGGMTSLTANSWGQFPQVSGYNLCYLRPEANLAAITEDEYQAPLIAYWQAGIGRVLSYMGEADGQFTGAIGRWSKSGQFFSTLAHWVSTQDQGLGADLLLTQEVRNGQNVFKLHLDNERSSDPFRKAPELSILRGREGEKPRAERLPLKWATADSLTAELPLEGGETVLTTLDIPGVGRTTLAPVCLPYSPEFSPRVDDEGTENLTMLAKATGGVERVNLQGIWSDIPKTPRYVSLAPWLITMALVLLLLDVLHRRTGLLSIGKRRRVPVTNPQGPSAFGREISRPGKKSVEPVKGPDLKDAKPKEVGPNSTTAPSEMDVFTQARHRASRRTRR